MKDINGFKGPEEREKEKYAYFGDFLGLKNFDDGWTNSMMLDFLDFCEDLYKSGFDIRVFESLERTLGEIRVVLRSNSLDEEKQEEIINITTVLQSDFLLEPVNQKIGFHRLKNLSLPIEIEPLEKNKKGYERESYQKKYAEILDLEYRLIDLNHRIGVLKDLSDDETVKSLLIQLKNESVLIERLISRNKQEMGNIKALLYLSLAGKEDDISSVKIPRKDAEIVSELYRKSPENKTNSLLSIVQETRKLVKDNRKFIKGFKLDQEKNQKDFLNKLEAVLVGVNGVEFVKTSGILTDYKTTNNNEVLKAKILGDNNSNVYLIDGKIHGFKLEGFDEEIAKIKIIGENDGNISSFYVYNKNGQEAFYYIKGENYIPFELDGIKFFKSFGNFDFKYTNGIKKFDYGKINVKNKKRIYFYSEDDIYKTLEIEGTKAFSVISINNESDGIPIHGKVKNDGIESLFYKNENKYNFLEIEGRKKFDYIAVANVTKGKIINGYVEIDSLKRFFYLKDGEYVYLEIDGQIEFEEIFVKTKESNYNLGWIKQNGIKKVFDSYDGELKIKKLGDLDDFNYSDSFNVKSDGSYFLHLRVSIDTAKGDTEKKIFINDNGKYKELKVEGVKIDEDYKLYYNSKEELICGIKGRRDKASLFFKLEDGSYKFMSFFGKKVFHDLSLNDKYKYDNDVLPLENENIYGTYESYNSILRRIEKYIFYKKGDKIYTERNKIGLRKNIK